MAQNAQQLRYSLDRTKGPNASIADAIVGKSLFFWNGDDLQFELCVFNDQVLDDISWIGTLTVEVKTSETDLGAPLMSKTVSSFDAACTLEDWIAGTAQHAVVTFTNSESTIDLLSAASRTLWLVVSATSTDTPLHLVTLGAAVITADQGPNPLPLSGPVQAGNLLPNGATYDGSGHYALTVTAAVNLSWTKGANDTSVTNGAQTVTVTDTVFVTQGTTITLNGTAGQLVTAVIRNKVFLTADQMDSRYIVIGSLPSTVMLRANNLSDVSSVSTARTNLGLGTSATHAATDFLLVANDLSDLHSASTARTNLGLGTAATHTTAFFLQAANNLSDVASASTSRTNLGLGTSATHASGDFLLTANNLSDVPTPATARTNLGLGTASTHASTDFLLAANNLSDVANATTALSNLGVGTVATHSVTEFLQDANSLSDLSSPSTARTNLSVYSTAQVDAEVYALPAKRSAMAATTTSITLVGEQTIDGYSAVTGNRILVKDMGSSNGVWIVSTGAWARSVDCSTANDFDYGMIVFVQNGTAYSGTTWEMTTKGTIVLNTTSLTFTQVTSASSVTTPITLSGSSIGIVNQGTTAQVLHGNAAGNASFGSVVNADIAAATIDLTAKVTGALPIANGGTAATTANAGFNALAPTTTKGDLISYSTVNARLGVGSNDTVLMADSSATTGIKWGTIVNSSITNGTIDLTTKVTGILPSANGGTASAFFTVSGPASSAKTFTFPNASSTVLTDNSAVTIPQGGTGQTTANPAFNALSPLTTKGDVLAYSTVNARVGVGTDGQVLTADAASTPGVKWATTAQFTNGQTFTSSGTWTKPGSVTFVRVVCVGAGGGGGGGRGGNASTLRMCGTGGGGGAFSSSVFLASDLSSTVAITVDSGGASGAGGSSANGSNGVTGGVTSFGAYLSAYGGGGGVGGDNANTFSESGGGGGGTGSAGQVGQSASSSNGGNPNGAAHTALAVGGQGAGGQSGVNGGVAEYGGGAGGGSNTSSGSGTGGSGDGGGSLYGGGGGGGGGETQSSNVQTQAGVGGAAGAYATAGGGTRGATSGGAGGNGADGNSTVCGSGGGGGGVNTGGTGGAGGNGGAIGGGAGGGGGGTTTGGAGGTGGRGECRIYAW